MEENMLFALDEEKNRVHIDSTLDNRNYYCPCCGERLIRKCGTMRIHHFAHSNFSNCNDYWHYDMSEWHFNWQNKFPKECQEVVKTLNGKTHRADVLLETHKVVFEFQHSDLSSGEFEDRNHFYNNLGYKVIWIFDVADKYDAGLIDNYKSNIWSWKKAMRTFYSYNYKNKNVELYLQISNEYDEIVRVTWCTDDAGLSRFATDGYYYDEYSIAHMFDDEVKSETSEYKISDLYDKMIRLYSKNHTTYFFGCPISSTHQCANSNIDIPQSDYNKIMPCIECQYWCEGNNNEDVICKKRFLDLGMDGNAIVRIEGRDQNNFINKLSYIVGDERKYVDLITYQQNITKSVFMLWKENDCIIGIFRNIKKDVYVKITKDPSEQYYKYKKVYGYFSREKYHFSSKSIELYDIDKPEWVIEWFKSKGEE